jgi:hypothetical protein
MLKPLLRLLLAVPLLVHSPGLAAAESASSPPYDYLLINGRLVDGTGNPWRKVDVLKGEGRSPYRTCPWNYTRPEGMTSALALESDGYGKGLPHR